MSDTSLEAHSYLRLIERSRKAQDLPPNISVIVTPRVDYKLYGNAGETVTYTIGSAAGNNIVLPHSSPDHLATIIAQANGNYVAWNLVLPDQNQDGSIPVAISSAIDGNSRQVRIILPKQTYAAQVGPLGATAEEVIYRSGVTQTITLSNGQQRGSFGSLGGTVIFGLPITDVLSPAILEHPLVTATTDEDFYLGTKGLVVVTFPYSFGESSKNPTKLMQFLSIG